jgi:membrane protein DedA with SNARE-associated domain
MPLEPVHYCAADRVKEMTDTMSLIEHFTYIGIFCILILGGLGFPFPEDGVLIIAGILIAQDVIRPVPTIAIVYPSIIIADFILYSIGKKYGRAVIYHRRFSSLISAATLTRLEAKFNRRGLLMIVAGRHMAGLRVPIFMISGMVGITRLKFLLVDAISAVFSVTITVGLGYFAGNSLLIIKRNMARVDHIIILALTALVLGVILISFFRRRKKEKYLSREHKSQVYKI